MNPFLIIGAAVGLLAWAFSRGGAKTPEPGAPAADWHDAIADATASGDPKQMRALADKLDAEGYTQAAGDLREQADAIDGSSSSTARRTVGTPAARSPAPRAAPRSPAPASSYTAAPGPRAAEPPPRAPPTASVASPPPNTPPNGLEQAMAVSRQLSLSGPWKESKGLKDVVKAFQSAHGLVSDGLYGSVMAQHIAAFNIVPPTPYYWPKENTRTVQKGYKQFLTDKAGEDPAQSTAWLAAAKKVVF